MTHQLVFFIIFGYFSLLILISYFTSKNADSSTFFTGNNESPWYLVAFGMIGASLSGVTFISIPGEVGTTNWTYFQVVLGYTLGYAVIGGILMPLYYRQRLVSIYGYLEERYGKAAYKTGSFFFLLSQTIGASFRLFLAAAVLQLGFFDAFGIPFEVTVIITIVLIWLYTAKGGIKTIVWTDTLQTFFMLAAVVLTIFTIKNQLSFSFSDMTSAIATSKYAQIFEWDWRSKQFFVKQFLSGAFIAIVMTGLDQNMMQKNLTCRNLQEAQKNMLWFTVTLVFVNILFLSLGTLLYLFVEAKGIALPSRTDELYPMLAFEHFGVFAGVLFLVGVVAAAYSSADSALTALTTSFCYDFMGFAHREEAAKRRIRPIVHLSFSAIMFVAIVIFRHANDSSVINSVFTAAGYTYGPLLGLFSFGLFTRIRTNDRLIPFLCVASPILSYVINTNSEVWFNGYKFGFEILLVNGAITFLGLWLLSFTVGKK